MTTKEQAQVVADTILEQLGRAVRMELAVKASFFVTEEEGGVYMHLSGCRATSGKRVKVVLTGADTYDVEVSKLNRRTLDLKVLDTRKGIDAASLRETVLRMAYGQ